MRWLFKLSGLFLIFSASVLIGFSKSLTLKKRQRKLTKIYCGMSSLSERIRLGSGDLENLLNKSFPANLVFYNDNAVKINPDYLLLEDIAILEEYFSNIGMSDSESECERIRLYSSLIEKQRSKAEEKCRELCKLYNTLGVLGGIFICIFLL